MDNQTTFLNEFNVTAPELSKDVNVIVASGGGSSTLIEKTITENGTYYASQDDADGYSSVEVNVEDSDMHTYSTAEQIVGTWIDGKPLYEITFHQNVVNFTSGYTDINITSLNVDRIVKFDGCTDELLDNHYRYNSPITYVYAGVDTTSVSEIVTAYRRCDVTSSGSNRDLIRLCGDRRISDPNNGFFANIIIQYTKTTDTANT